MSKEEYDKNKEALELSNGNEPLVKFSELTGIQSKLTEHIFNSCLEDPNGISGKITVKELSEVADTSAPSVKKSVLRLRDKNILFKGGYKDGRGGWTQYVLNRIIFEEMKLNLETIDESSNEVESKLAETVDDEINTAEKVVATADVSKIVVKSVDESPAKATESKEKDNKHHDDHDDHSFPNWVTFGHTDDPVDGFIKIFGWLVFWTILEVLAIIQEFESFALNMAVLFGIALIKCWFICSFFMHMTWDPPLVNRTAAVPFFFLAVLFLAVGLTTPGAVDDLATICGF